MLDDGQALPDDDPVAPDDEQASRDDDPVVRDDEPVAVEDATATGRRRRRRGSRVRSRRCRGRLSGATTDQLAGSRRRRLHRSPSCPRPFEPSPTTRRGARTSAASAPSAASGAGCWCRWDPGRGGCRGYYAGHGRPTAGGGDAVRRCAARAAPPAWRRHHAGAGRAGDDGRSRHAGPRGPGGPGRGTLAQWRPRRWRGSGSCAPRCRGERATRDGRRRGSTRRRGPPRRVAAARHEGRDSRPGPAGAPVRGPVPQPLVGQPRRRSGRPRGGSDLGPAERWPGGDLTRAQDAPPAPRRPGARRPGPPHRRIAHRAACIRHGRLRASS